MDGSRKFSMSQDEILHAIGMGIHCFLGAFVSCLAAYLIAHPIGDLPFANYAIAAGTTACGGALSFVAWKFFPDTRTPEQKQEPKP